MFELLKSPSRSAAGAILYVTIGLLLIIWSGLWYYYYITPEPAPPTFQRFVCVGLMLSGLVITAIGLLFGLIGRRAKSADTTVGVAPAGPVVTEAVTTDANTAGVVAAPAVTAAPVVSAPVNAARR